MLGRLISTTPLSPDQGTNLLLILIALTAGVVIAVTAIVAGVLHSVLTTRSDAALKQAMIARGMSAEEIARVINIRSVRAGGVTDLPCASEVVVEWQGDWLPALVLQAAEGRYFIHYVGNDMTENEWVGVDRIRFPAGSCVPDLATQPFPDRNGAPAKGLMASEV